MKYKYENIDRFMEYKSWSDKQKIDQLLHIDCNLYANLGTDSTKDEKDEVKRKSLIIYRLIKTLDRKLGDELLYSMDMKR
tara:strand:- start:809 stop:1048 length:240 start_codon:yes stop_codon:yes gene_type:complete